MRIRWVVVLTIGFVFWGWCLFGAAPVAVRVSPRIGMTPLTVATTVILERHELNRELCFFWGIGEEGLYSSSCVGLDGAQSQRVFYFQRTFREPGVWAVIAQLRRADDSMYRAVDMVEVAGGT